MDPRRVTVGQVGILYDAALLGQLTLERAQSWLCEQRWRSAGTVEDSAAGRGTTLFVESDSLGGFVLRRYQRGGWMAPLMTDRYLWTGALRARPVREWRLLARLFAAGLPVPRPVAAGYWRAGPTYRAALLTCRLWGTQSLAQRLSQAPLPASTWRAIGACIRRFHQAGVDHADLNAHNVLIDAVDRAYLVDFDRGRLRRPAAGWRRRNLARLLRSLRKLGVEQRYPGFMATAWRSFEHGYERAHSAPVVALDPDSRRWAADITTAQAD